MLATPCARDYRFLLTPLREGRHKLPVPLLRSAFDFYSRPCGRGDHLLADQRFTEALISTHAPAGGATVDGALDRKNLPNFYSRPCGRGDGYAGLYQVLHADDFYSRPCGRGDGLHACEQPIDVLISTHAPAGGATSSSLSSRHSRSVFLLTPLREGRRKAVCHRHVGAVISTHAPAGGATIDAMNCGFRSIISTHAPAGGATGLQLQAAGIPPISTHAPAGGATGAAVALPTVERFISTHAPAGGATRRWNNYPARGSHFYSRPCGRGDRIARLK